MRITLTPQTARRAWPVLILAVGLALLLAACAGQSQAKKDQPAGSEEPIKETEFFDSFSFDAKLSSALRSDQPEVLVTFPEAPTVNDIPERLDKWFQIVEEKGGTVKLAAEPPPGTRGIIGAVIDLVVGAYEFAKDKVIYGPAEDYNALVFYEKGSGKLTRVLFTRKPEADQPEADNPEAKPE